MQWEAAPLFPTPVFKLRIEDTDKAKTFFYDTLFKEGDHKDVKGQLSHYHSRANVFNLYPELDWLRDILETQARFVYQDLMNYKLSGPPKITNAWFNLCGVGGTQKPHSHVNCLLCGTLYLHTDAQSRLQFFHPQNATSSHAELFDKADDGRNEFGLKFHQRTTQFPVSDGDCLFWPAHLQHGYENNPTPNRLSLSFNMMPDPLNVDYQVNPAQSS